MSAALALLAAGLAWLGFAGVCAWPLAFVAFVPLFAALDRAGRSGGLRVFAIAWLFGAVLWGASCSWLLFTLRTFSGFLPRIPLLALGELSKRSLGTFRWVRTAAADSWKAAFGQLHDEIAKQYVITYFVCPSEDVAGKKLHPSFSMVIAELIGGGRVQLNKGALARVDVNRELQGELVWLLQPKLLTR